MKTTRMKRYKVRYKNGEERVVRAKHKTEAWQRAWDYGTPTRCEKLPSRIWLLFYVALVIHMSHQWADYFSG